MSRSWVSRLFLSLLVTMGLVMSSVVAPGGSLAQSPSPVVDPPDTEPPEEKKSGSKTGEIFTVEVYEGDLNAYNAALEDCGTPSLECLVHYTYTYTAIEMSNRIVGVKLETSSTDDSSSGPDGSLVGGMSFLIGEMYRRPVAQTGVYVADLMNSMNIATPAYAQGLGFAALNPVLGLWKIFRNLSYVFFVIILLILGFMIMFRKKIGGQAAVTAQQAIPSVVIALVFVTFSYAIAGLMIDMMYLSMFMIIGLFDTTTGFNENILNFNIIKLMLELFKGTGGDLDTTSDIVETFLEGLTGTDAGGNIIGFIGGLTLSLVIAIAILIGTFKLFFELLKAYAEIVLHTITAPIVLMIGAIPGKSNVFTLWIRKMVGNLIPFPLVLMVATMFYFFTDNIGASGVEGGFMPPFLLGRGQASTISALMGFALILALPELVKHYKEEIAGKGGIGELIYGWASGAVKDTWSNKYVGLRGMPAKAGKALDYASKPGLATAGLLGGGYLGWKHAKDSGMSGWKKALAITGGAMVGAGTGLNAPKAAKSLISGTARQSRDAIIRMGTEQFQTRQKAEMDRDTTDVRKNLAKEQLKVAEMGTPDPSLNRAAAKTGNRFPKKVATRDH